MRVNYKVEYQENNEWKEIVYWERDLYDELPLDEELDSGAIAIPPSKLIDIKPFTPLRITTYNADTNEQIDKVYRLSADIEETAETLYVDKSV